MQRVIFYSPNIKILNGAHHLHIYPSKLDKTQFFRWHFYSLFLFSMSVFIQFKHVMVVTLNSFHFYVPLLLLTNLYSQTFWTKTLMRGERSKFIMCISHAIIIDVSAYIIFTIWRIHLGASWFSSKVKKTFWHHYHVCNITIKHAHFNTRMPFSLHLNKSYLFHIMHQLLLHWC